MADLTFQITGGVNVEITITELADGTLRFDINVLDTTGSIGDLRGVFFDLADDSLTYGMSVTGTDVTDEMYKIDGVSNTGGGNNVNGDIVNEYGKFDVGVEIGTQGISNDDIQSTSFILSHDTESLSLADLELQDMAIRLTSVGDPDGARNGSLKLGGEVPEAQPEWIANDDVITVSETETAGDTELLDDGSASVLANDTEDGSAYSGTVLGVNGSSAHVGQMVVGSNGGLLMVNADGTVDFDANGEFDALNDGESEQTIFTYEIEDGQIATVTVNVLGEGSTIVLAAIDDMMTVFESETFGDADLLDSGDDSVLDNDTENGGAYTDVVGSVNGSLGNVNSFVAGSNGGLLKINADGTVDFDANGEFDSLAAGESTTTTFTYTLISGEEATVTVNVQGETNYDAFDDALTVMESETAGDLETLDSGATTVLANDTEDGNAYTGQVVGGGVQVTGSNGGLATIYADGTIDFDANDEFDYLNAGDTATTSFTYEIAGGEMANVVVNVQGEDDVSTGQVINLALMLGSTDTLNAQADTIANGLAAYADWNGNGLTNQVIDMAYLMLEDFMSDAFAVAAAAGATLNISLISFASSGPQYWTVLDDGTFETMLDVKAADNSPDYGTGFDNANAWFDTVSTGTETNAAFFIGDGFSSDPFDTELNALVADHNVDIQSYIPDVVFSGPQLAAMDLIDTDGSSSIFVEDTATAALYGVTAGVDALSLDHLLA